MKSDDVRVLLWKLSENFDLLCDRNSLTLVALVGESNDFASVETITLSLTHVLGQHYFPKAALADCKVKVVVTHNLHRLELRFVFYR